MNIEKLKDDLCLEGKVAIVTGASGPNGQGRAAARALAVRGAKIVVTDKEEKDSTHFLDETVAELKALGTEAIGVKADITNIEQIRVVVNKASDTFGGIDILINNTNYFCGCKPLSALTESDWEQTFKVNILGVTEFCTVVIPHMQKRGGGAIVNNISTYGQSAIPGFSAYGISQTFLLGLSRTLATEYGKDNIRTNAIVSGHIYTDSMKKAVEDYAMLNGITIDEAMNKLKNTCSLKTIGYPEDTAEVAAFLVSPAAGYVNGVTLPVDGGLMEAALHY